LLFLLIPGSWAFAQSTLTPAPVTELISIVVTPANLSIASGETQQFTATGFFRGGGRQNLTAWVIWASSAPGVATIKAGGLVSSVSPGSTTITATYVSFTPQGVARGVTPGTPIINSPPMSPIGGSTTLTVAEALACTDSGNESLLSGQYAFSLSGFNPSGYLAVVGSFTADGTGKITAGEADTNGALGPLTSTIDPSTSSYSVGSNHLGCATIATSFGTFNTRLSLGSIASSVATEGRMVEWDAPTSSAYIATGHILQQTASSFSGGLSGSYAFERVGVDHSNAPVGIVGVISASGGSLTNGEMDINDAGTTYDIPGEAGTYGSADSNGRFTMAVAVPFAGTSHAAAYMVSSSQLLCMTTDPVASMGVLTGEMKQQSVPSGGFSNSSLNAAAAFYMSGLSGSGKGDAVIGILTGNGAGFVTFEGEEDDGGKTSIWGTMGSCSYSVAANGRVATSGTNCPSPIAWYLTAPNTGFILAGVESPIIGQVEPQTGGPFTDASLSSGTFYDGDVDVVNQAQHTDVEVPTLNGSGGVSIIGDYTATTFQTSDQTGRVMLTVNSDGTFSTSENPGVIDGIIISSNKSVVVDNQGGTYPGIEVVKQ
jgi:hypothetical protein